METEVKIRKRRKQRKAPEAPKKALTPYIFYSQEIRPQVKASQEPGTKVTEIVRIIAEKWSAMSDEDKIPYVKMAEEDKIRYNQEISTYEGPLHVPITKKKGHNSKIPGAPKRAMSPFLFFSNEKRNIIQEGNPNMKITEVSAKLGQMWRSMTDEEKEPYVQKSKEDRERYKSEQSEFKGRIHQAINTKPTLSISNVPVVVPSAQWNMALVDGSVNQMYPRVYEMAQQPPSFTNISIPLNFSNIVQ